MADVLERRPSGGLFSRASSSSSQSSASGKVNEFNLVARVKALAALRRVRSVSEQASHELQEMRNVQLFEAAEGGDYETVCSLLQLKANPQEHADGVGFTALLAASNQGHDKIVEILIAASVDIDYQTKTSGLPWIQHGATALMLASLFGHVKVVQVLLANKAR